MAVERWNFCVHFSMRKMRRNDTGTVKKRKGKENFPTMKKKIKKMKKQGERRTKEREDVNEK